MAFFRPVTTIFGPEMLFFDIAGAIAAAAMATVLAVTVGRNTRELYQAERV